MNDAEPAFRTPKQKQDDRSAKRKAVLRAAVRMFNERGFHATSLDDVAASLGISKPTIYHYLGNKDQVLLECVTIGLHRILEAVEIVRQQPGTSAERLSNFLLRYAEVMMDDHGRCVVRTGDEFLSRESAQRFQSLKRKIDGEMRRLIEEGIADGSIAPVDSKLLAFTLAGALNWPARWHDADGTLSTQEIASQMVSILTAGFMPRG